MRHTLAMIRLAWDTPAPKLLIHNTLWLNVRLMVKRETYDALAVRRLIYNTYGSLPNPPPPPRIEPINVYVHVTKRIKTVRVRLSRTCLRLYYARVKNTVVMSFELYHIIHIHKLWAN